MQRTTVNFIKLLEAAGWYLARKGKHKVFRHPEKTTRSGRPMIVSHGKKEIKLPTWESMFHDAKLDEPDETKKPETETKP